jgi:hypothetical protein
VNLVLRDKRGEVEEELPGRIDSPEVRENSIVRTSKLRSLQKLQLLDLCSFINNLI